MGQNVSPAPLFSRACPSMRSTVAAHGRVTHSVQQRGDAKLLVMCPCGGITRCRVREAPRRTLPVLRWRGATPPPHLSFITARFLSTTAARCRSVHRDAHRGERRGHTRPTHPPSFASVFLSLWPRSIVTTHPAQPHSLFSSSCHSHSTCCGQTHPSLWSIDEDGPLAARGGSTTQPIKNASMAPTAF